MANISRAKMYCIFPYLMTPYSTLFNKRITSFQLIVHPLISQRYPRLAQKIEDFLMISKCSSPSPAIPNNTVTTF